MPSTELAVLLASGTVLEDPLLSDALVAMVHDAESARAEDARVSLEVCSAGATLFEYPF